MAESVFDTTAADCCIELPHVKQSETLSTVEPRFEQGRYHTLPIVDSTGDFIGVLEYPDLLRKLRDNPKTTKVENLVQTPPRVTSTDTLVDLAVLRRDSGERLFLLEDDANNHVVPEEEIAFAAADCTETGEVTAFEYATTDLTLIHETETTDEARNTLIQDDISQLPVTNENRDLTGIIYFTDVLRRLKPVERMTEGEVQGEKEPRNVQISSLMQPHCLTTEDRSMSMADALAQMREEPCNELVFVEDGEPVGIFTVRDALQYLAELHQSSGIEVNLVGTDVDEEQAVLMRKAEHFVTGRTIGMVRDPHELKVHVKKQRKDGKQHLYTINVQFFSNLGTLTTSAEDWDMLNAMDEAVEKLETRIKKNVERKRDAARSPRE